MFEIIVICTGNICRSPMAAGLLKHLLPADLKAHVNVGSAGTHALVGHPPAAHATATMARLGIDISGHKARQVSRELARRTDLMLVMEMHHLEFLRRLLSRHRAKAALLTRFHPAAQDPEITDPYGAPLAAYEACLQTIRPCVEGLIHKLTHEVPPGQFRGVD